MKKKRAVHLVLNTFTNDSRVLKEARTLAANGFDVYVLAIQDDQKKLPLFESEKGISVKRIHLKTKKLAKQRLVQIIKYCEFFFNAIKILKKIDPDVVHCHDINTLPIGIMSRRPVIYDTHEYQRGRNGLSPVWKKIVSIIENILAKKADFVITVSDEISALLRNRLKRDVKVLLNTNSSEETNFNSGVRNCNRILRNELGLDSKTKIVTYPGLFTTGRGIEYLIDSIKFLDDNIVVALIGYGPLKKELENKIKSKQLNERAFILPAVPQNQIVGYISSSDLGIIPTPSLTTSINAQMGHGNKFFHFISAGLPVAVPNHPAKSVLVSKYGLGIIINPENLEETARKINTFLNHEKLYLKCKRRVRNAQKDFNWSIEEGKLLKIYQQLLF